MTVQRSSTSLEYKYGESDDESGHAQSAPASTTHSHVHTSAAPTTQSPPLVSPPGDTLSASTLLAPQHPRLAARLSSCGRVEANRLCTCCGQTEAVRRFCGYPRRCATCSWLRATLVADEVAGAVQLVERRLPDLRVLLPAPDPVHSTAERRPAGCHAPGGCLRHPSSPSPEGRRHRLPARHRVRLLRQPPRPCPTSGPLRALPGVGGCVVGGCVGIPRRSWDDLRAGGQDSEHEVADAAKYILKFPRHEPSTTRGAVGALPPVHQYGARLVQARFAGAAQRASVRPLGRSWPARTPPNYTPSARPPAPHASKLAGSIVMIMLDKLCHLNA